jgi:hypothetical protein
MESILRVVGAVFLLLLLMLIIVPGRRAIMKSLGVPNGN